MERDGTLVVVRDRVGLALGQLAKASRWLWLSKGQVAQSMVEYAIVAALVAVVAFVAVKALGGQVQNSFDKVCGEVQAANQGDAASPAANATCNTGSTKAP